jgi:hypothetical protein
MSATTNRRSALLAARLEQGANDLIAFANGLNDAQWMTRVPGDGRTVGVLVHHVGNMYPIEIQLAQLLAAGKPVAGVAWSDVHGMNAGHAKDFAAVTKEAAIEIVKKNSTAAAAAIRALSDDELDQASPVSLNSDAPLTCQFFLEDHAVRHSFHHLAKMRAALGK